MAIDADTTAQPAAEEARVFQRVCRHCSAQTTTNDPNCPACGGTFVRPPVITKRRLLIAALVLGVMVTAVSAWSLVQARQAQQAEQAAATAAAAEQTEAERVAAAKRAAEAEERRERRATVGQIEKSITIMARGHASDGIIDGPIFNSQCDPVAGGSLDDLTDSTTKFSCLAVNEKLSGGRVSGYTYHAIMNWDSGKYSYGLGD